MLVQRTTEDISALIVKGYNMPGVQESHSTFIGRGYYQTGYKACAIGMAYIGLVGDPEQALRNYYRGAGITPHKFFSEELGIPVELVKKISLMHCSAIPAVVIANKILPWKIVKDKVKKPNLYQRIKAWWFKKEPEPQPYPQLKLVTNS